jgi:hypothetical protein
MEDNKIAVENRVKARARNLRQSEREADAEAGRAATGNITSTTKSTPLASLDRRNSTKWPKTIRRNSGREGLEDARKASR